MLPGEKPIKDDKVKKRNKKLLGSKFRLQIKDLMQELKSSGCHFIRCLKQNEEKKPGVFNSHLVLNQIRYLGIVEIINIRKELYPVRIPYESFQK